ncbi:hypothetical protein KNU14_gp12 [Gordonia phage Buggaboo]|uniref:Uncharacterized protein n=1 Tax=Gordonia phage Buggaboo TaxID=2315529 RepID=A0A386KDA0_9CAUD|nr:hypothetical protein KNU14_gp12 [Gordonia phage Buggaboo]AVE00671.1 hypothetical protein SEA_SUPERSULLEY_12 [Gordonia phage SuperSulley]AYD83204.1 hypothetical protein SEA_BUGGABOO_12 [Gordonia phage Buggaboo]
MKRLTAMFAGLRFRREYAVEWVHLAPDPSPSDPYNQRVVVTQSEATRSWEVAKSASKMLNKGPGVIWARVVERSVREEREHWWLPWRTTGETRWYELELGGSQGKPMFET